MNPVINSIFKVIITCQEDDEEDVLTNEEYDKLKRVIYEAFKHSWKTRGRHGHVCAIFCHWTMDTQALFFLHFAVKIDI